MSSPNFTYDVKRGGVFAHEYQIVPYPSPVIRRQALLDIVGGLPEANAPGKFIEIGYGTGVFAYEFYKMGFDVFGYDTSEYAYSTANGIFNSDKTRLKLKKELSSADKSAYDILGAFEVLEHIEDDAAALREWSGLLRDHGMLLLSVPARMKAFGERDTLVGHFRRYEKNELCELLAATGFEVIKIISYGFPVPKMINKLSEVILASGKRKKLEHADMAHKTSISGIERTEEYRFNKVMPYKLFVLFSKIQRLFYHTDLGLGYTVAARKLDVR